MARLWSYREQSRSCNRPAGNAIARGIGSIFSGLALCWLLIGCRTPIDGGYGLAPLVELGPPSPAVIERSAVEVNEENAPGSSVHLWPLYSRTKSEFRTETRVLYPLFKDEFTPHERRSWLLPLFHRSKYTHFDGGVDTQTLLLPFFYGSDHELGSYFSLFPLGGTAKGILGLDRIDYALFPLYARATDRDRVSHHVLFPIFNWTKGDRVRGGRVFPLFSRYTGYTPEGKKRYSRNSYLWPLIHIHDSDLETDDPTHVRWFWPFYGQVKSDRLRRYSIAWPFIGKDIHPRRQLSSVYLFPLLRFAWERDNLIQYDFYPFYGHRNYRGNSRSFALWPFIGWEAQLRENYERRSRWFFPIYRHTERERIIPAPEGEFEGSVERTAMTRVWPFYRYRAHADGRQEWNLLDPLPFVDPPGFDAFYSRIWRIYREVDNPREQRRAWEFLWGIAGGSRTPKESRWSVLGGLIGRTDRPSEDGTSTDTTWRVLYIPF